MKALVLTPSTREAAVRELSRPVPGVGEVLIRVHAVALNPVDSLYVSHPIAIQEYRVIGTDFAGIVVGASPELAGSPDPRTKSGGRVAGFLQGGLSILFLFASSLHFHFPDRVGRNNTDLTVMSPR